MSDSTQLTLVKYCLFLGLALLLPACGGGGGGGDDGGGETTGTALVSLTAPASFDFATSETVTFALAKSDHGLTGNLLYVKVSLDPAYTNQLYLGRLAADGSVNVPLSVPVAATTLYYQVYGVGETKAGTYSVGS